MSVESLFSGKSRKLYEDKLAWHNQFCKQVTMQVNESLFNPLYCSNNGSPNASIRVLIAMMILNEAQGLRLLWLFKSTLFNTSKGFQ